jgi:peptidoglycan/xylan/chitin deacetylase (PgdA/CDA1 family)
MSVSVPVLLYHAVDDHPGRLERPYAVSPSLLSAHADAVRASERTAVPISDLAAGLRGERPLPARPLAITFDDGYANNFDAAHALLQRGLSSTLYVTSSDVGGPGRLTASQLAELASLAGVEIGAHAVRHRRLDELDGRELREEVRASKLRLEELIGMEVPSFSYPHGAYDRRVRKAVAAAGYRSAVAVKNALSHDRDDPFAIARWTVTWGTSASRIAEVIEGEGVRRAWSRERLRTRAFRVARRSRRQLGRPRRAAR